MSDPDEARALIAEGRKHGGVISVGSFDEDASWHAAIGWIRSGNLACLLDGYAEALAEIERLRSELDADRLHESAEAFAARMGAR